MRRRGALILLLVAVIVVALVLKLSPNRQRIVMRDGAEIELRGTTYGTEHHFFGGSLRHRILGMLPAKLRKKLNLQVPTYKTASTNLVFWVTRSASTQPRFLLCDESEYRVAATIWQYSAPASHGADDVEPLFFAAFPRRSKFVRVRVFEQDDPLQKSRELGEWKVRNPDNRSYPVWMPDPLPITKQQDDLNFTLSELVVGVSFTATQEAQPARNPGEAFTKAVFRITGKDGSTNSWSPVSLETSDATGNTMRKITWTKKSFHDGQHIIHFKGGLWPSEPAWKLRVEFSRRADFAPDELWNIQDLPLTATNFSSNPAYRTNLQGAMIRLEMFRPNFGQGNSLLLVRATEREGSRLTLVKAADDQGRTVQNFGSGEGGGTYAFDLKCAPDAKALNLAFALHRSRFVEFVAKPVVLSATNSRGEQVR